MGRLNLLAYLDAFRRASGALEPELGVPQGESLLRRGEAGRRLVHASSGRQRGHDGGAPEARSRRLCLPALAVGALAIDNERLTA